MSNKKQTTEHMFTNTLKDKIAFGESKHQQKHNLNFGESTYKIYSYNTYDTYLKECLEYANWLKTEKGVSKVQNLEETEKYAKEYIQSRLDANVSVWTAKLDRSALGMLYGKRIEVEMPVRDNKSIKRSRFDSVSDAHISRTGKYKDVFDIALGTGCRRCDLVSLGTDCLVERDGLLYVQIHQSKGGRDRLSPVRQEYAEQVKNIVNQAKIEGKKTVFEGIKIPNRIDVHSLRREYCKNLYEDIKDNSELRDKMLKNYPPRHEIKRNIDKNGNAYTKPVKRDFYKDRDGNIYSRDDVYLLSQALGHNRLDVSITHYLKN